MAYPDDDFDQVQRLLKCKRYEQPPPGYFNSFSDKVIARIQAEQSAPCSSWWRWLTERFDAKPVFLCAYGLAVSSLLFMGFRLSQAFEAEAMGAPAVSGPWLATAAPGSPLVFPLAANEPEHIETTPVSFASHALFARHDATSHLGATRLEVHPAGAPGIGIQF